MSDFSPEQMDPAALLDAPAQHIARSGAPDRRAQLASYIDNQRDDLEVRRSKYAEITSAYYDLATDFYEYGWGPSFHFAPRWKGDSLRDSLVRHEHWLAHKLNLSPGGTVLDLGCGVGGPMRSISQFSGAHILGININNYQVARARKLNEQHGATNCDVIEGDFMKIPLAEGTADAAYAIEATVHGSDPVRCYSEIRRVLKAGGLLGSFEWCMTPLYDPLNAAHVAIKRQIEVSCGIANVPTFDEILSAIGVAGLDLLEHQDRALLGDVPWWEPMAPQGLSFSSFRASPAGARVTNAAVGLLELFNIAPRGSLKVGKLLALGGDALVEGGRTKIFTPMFFVLARRPHTGGV